MCLFGQNGTRIYIYMNIYNKTREREREKRERRGAGSGGRNVIGFLRRIFFYT